MTMRAQPGGLIPEHLWVSCDEDKMVVSVLAPEVAGTARHDTVGPVTVVSPYPESRTGPGGMVETRLANVGLWTPRSGGARLGWVGAAGSAVVAAASGWVVGVWAGLAVAGAGFGLSVWQGLRRYTRVARQWSDGHLALTRHEDRAVIDQAVRCVRYTTGVWPRLRAVVDLDDPAPVLVRQLWDLAVTVSQRAEVRDLRQRLLAAGHGVPAGSTTAANLADRIVRTDEELARLTTDIDQRRQHLQRLTDEAAAFVTEQQALARANAMIRDADQRNGVPTPAPPSIVSDLADHTTAVLAAYRELTQQSAGTAPASGADISQEA
jgi:hypothetical protein